MKKFVGLCFLLLITIDLLLADRTYVQLARQSFYSINTIAHAEFLQNPNYRIFSKPIVIPQDRRFLPGPNYFYLQSQLNLQSSTDDHAASKRILSISGYTVLVLKRYANYLHSTNITGITPSNITHDELNMLSVKYVLSQDVKNHLIITENHSVLPRARLMSLGNATILSSTPNKVTIAAQSKTKNNLILADAFYPGWDVYVNGKKSLVVSYMNVFREVPILSGKSIVVFSYDPIIWKIGTVISCVGFLICMIFLMI